MKVFIVDRYDPNVEYSDVVLCVGSNRDFETFVARHYLDIWKDRIHLKHVKVTQINITPETEIFQRDLEESQINILIDYYKVKLNDQNVEIHDLRN